MIEADLQTTAWEGIRHSYESGRMAHAYVIVGAPRGNACQLAESFLKLLFCQSTEKPCHECAACHRIESHQHVDTLWIEPRSKSRQILADDIRSLIQRMTQTSFEGGWKAGIIISADCMNESSENALLKTLEEPPKNTLLLLLTDSPQSLLPTILSRCHKIVLPISQTEASHADWRNALTDLLHALPPQSGLEAARLGAHLKMLLNSVKEDITEEVGDEMADNAESMDASKLKEVLAARINARLKEVQGEVFLAILHWYRDILMLINQVNEEQLINDSELEYLKKQAALHTSSSALNSIQIIEGMARRLDRNIPDVQIFDEAFRMLIR